MWLYSWAILLPLTIEHDHVNCQEVWFGSWAILPPLIIEHDHVKSQFVCNFIPELVCHHWPLNMTVSIPRAYVILSLSYSATTDHWTWSWQFLGGMWFYARAILPPLTIEHDHVNSQRVCDFNPELFCHHWSLNMTVSIPSWYVISSLTYSPTTDHWTWPCQFPVCMWFYPWAILPPLTIEYDHVNSQPVCHFITELFCHRWALMMSIPRRYMILSLSYSTTTDHETCPCQFPGGMWFHPWAILPPLTMEHDHINSQPVCDFIPELFCHHWPLNMIMSIPSWYMVLSLSYSAITDHSIWPCQFPGGMWFYSWAILLPLRWNMTMSIPRRYVISSLSYSATTEHWTWPCQFSGGMWFIPELFCHHWPLDMTMSTPSQYVIISLSYSATTDHWPQGWQFPGGM
jgi:hypothetical protein